MTSGCDWSPYLSGEQAERARAVVDEIAAALTRIEVPDVHLTGGAAGVATFLSYYAAAFSDQAAEQRATALLGQVLEALPEGRMGPQLSGGLAGIGWTFEHLAPADGSEADPNVVIDRAIAGFVAKDEWRVDYDLISGLVGFAVYALERLPRPSAVALLERVVFHFDQLAAQRDVGLTWHTPADLLPPNQLELAPDGYDNLGLAHGVPGVIAILARVVAEGIAVEPARRLLHGGAAWLLAQRLDRSDARYAAWVADEPVDQPARSAWCYGDPGVAIALLGASRCVSEPTWEKAAIELARGVIARPKPDRLVRDAGLCHGAFGLAHIFARFFHATGAPEFAAAAAAQVEDGLNYREPGRGVAGFSPHDPRGQLPDADPGLLMGAAGIGLALLAACTHTEPGWDRVLLFDVPEVDGSDS